MIALATPGFCSKNAVSLSLTSASTWPRTSEFPSFVLVCPSNCGLGILTEIDRGEPLAHVLALELKVFRVLAEVGRREVRVDRAGQRGLEAHHVRAALDGVDRVRERVDRLVVRVVPLHRDLELDAVHAARQEDRLAGGAPAGPCSGAGRTRRSRPRSGRPTRGSFRPARPASVISMPWFRNASSRRRCARVS